MIALEHICPRCCFITTIKFDLFEFREGTINAFRETGRVDRFARAHAPDSQAREHCLRGNDQGWVCGRGKDCDVRRESEHAQMRTTRSENGQTGGGNGARLHCEECWQVERLDGARPQVELLDLGPPARDGCEI